MNHMLPAAFRAAGSFSIQNAQKNLGKLTVKTLKKWSIIRSDLCENLSKEDVTTLKEHKILTNIDMRGAAESDYRDSFFKDRDDFSFVHAPIEEGASFPDSVEILGLCGVDKEDIIINKKYNS